MIGTTIGHYRILDRLGAGGMGEVWLAEDLELGRRVALKALRGDLAGSPEKQARFDREARAIAALNHPNIVTLYAAEPIDGLRYLVMEYVEGVTLDDRIGPAGMPVREILQIGAAIAAALEAAHQRGIVHRDLKPGNVLISKDGRVKVVDFGLARALGPASGALGALPRETSLTQEGLAVGTLHYMSPEQLQNRPVDARSDLFALGVVLYEMATGRMPFAGDSAAQVISSMLRDPPGQLDEGRLPPMLVDLIEALLDKEPENRPASAGAVRERLEAMFRLLDSETAALPASVSAEALRPLRRRASPGRLRRATPWLAAAAVVAAVAAILVARPWRSEPAPPPAPAVAVLPLADYSGEPDYFVDGMTDGVINALSRIEQLRVLSRQSTMHYKGSSKRLPEIAHELGADYLVEASVRRDGEELRLDAKLFRPDPERQLWTDSFVRPARNVLALHADLARAVAAEIHVNLSPEITKELTTVRSVVPAAYEAYLRGSHLVEQGRAESVRSARDYFEEAVRLDPSFAPAFAGLGRVYFFLAYLFEDPAENARRLEEVTGKALELDPGLPEAHVLVGNLRRYFEWDWPAAEASFRRALELDPNNLRAHRASWALLASLGRLEEARDHLELARRLDPLSAAIETDFGYQALFEGSLERGEQEFRRALELDPAYPYAHAGLWVIFETQGRDPDRRTELELWMRGIGRTDIADEIRREREQSSYLDSVRRAAELLEQRAADEHVSLGSIASLLVSAGDLDRAEQWIESAFRERSPGLVWLAMDPAWDKLRHRPGVRRILEAMRLPPYAAKSGRDG